MEQAASIDAFVAEPVGRWVVAGKTITWCRRPSLAGCVAWGRASVEDTRETIQVFEGLFGPSLAGAIDLVLDARRVESIDPEALGLLLAWLAERRDAIAGRVRLQVGVIPEGVAGITLAGILPALGSTHHPFVVERDALVALRSVAPDEAESLAEELGRALGASTGVSPLIRRLRELLRERPADAVVDAAARVLGLSTRSLQRSLKTEGTSFQAELREARVARAVELLTSTDEKVAGVAARVGVNESTLAELVRERFGLSPAEYRKTHARR